MIAIIPQLVAGLEAHFADYKAKNESIVRVNFFDADKRKIASRIVGIPSEEELTEENVWKAAKVVPA